MLLFLDEAIPLSKHFLSLSLIKSGRLPECDEESTCLLGLQGPSMYFMSQLKQASLLPQPLYDGITLQ